MTLSPRLVPASKKQIEVMKTNNPLEVVVSRGNYVESTHLVDAIVVDTNGKPVEIWGMGEREIFPRSSAKALQALLLVESGAADAFGFEDRHLALACSSHHASPQHVEEVQTMLDRIGLNEACLECGAMLPHTPEDQAELAKSGEAVGAIHNTCSGKHAGFLAAAKYLNIEAKGYIEVKHPLQREIALNLEAVTGQAHSNDNHAIDGCSIPTYRIGMGSLAKAFARFGVGEDISANRSKAMLRLRDACLQNPEMIAGSSGGCTRIMNALGARAFVKFGAEGVYTCALPELGYGIVLKVRDGNIRAAEVAIASVISGYLKFSDSEAVAMSALTNTVLKNWNGVEVGHISTKRV